MNKKSYIKSIILVVVAFVVLAIISERYYFRIDLTEGGQYSMSEATKDILRNLDKPIMVTAYFTKDLAPDLDKVKRNFKEMLVEYSNLSNGNIVFKFVNPNEDKETENEALTAGVQPVLFKARDKDEVKQQKVFMGAKITMDDKKEVIPFLNPEGNMEYTLTTAIKKLSVDNKPLVGFVQGQGESGLDAYQQVRTDLEVLYDVREVYLSDTVLNIDDYQTLVIDAPVTPFSEEALRVLDFYLEMGGNLYIAFNRVNGNTQTLQGEENITGIEKWLAKQGVVVEDKFVVDANCGTVSVTQPTGRFNMTTQMKFPFLPALTKFADFPITKGLEQIIIGFPSPIRYSGDSSSQFTPLAFTSEHSGLLGLPVVLDVQKQWNAADFQDGEQVVAGLLEKEFRGRESKIIVVTAGGIAVSGTGQRQRRLVADNVSLMVNSIEWLSDETGLMDLRTKEVTSRPIEQVSDSKKIFIKWLNFLLPMALVVAYGIIRMQYRRNQRRKRMNEGWVK